MHIPNSDKPAAFYSLDIILAVGYRANSKRAIEFRQWATKILHTHIAESDPKKKEQMAALVTQLLK